MTSVKCNSLRFDFIFNIFYLCIGAFDWNYDASTKFYLAMDCDFPGADSSRIRMRNNSTNCLSACDRDPVCTHFTYYSGTCFLKSGHRHDYQAIFSRGAVCGIWENAASGPHEEPQF